MASPTYKLARLLAASGICGLAATCAVRRQTPNPWIVVRKEGDIFYMNVHNYGGTMCVTDVRFKENGFYVENFVEFAYSFFGQEKLAYHFPERHSHMLHRWARADDVYKNGSLTLVTFAPRDNDVTKAAFAAQMKDVRVRLDYSYLYVPVFGYVMHTTKELNIVF
jgi:hypothetical protein